jgi:hypothetical protein
MNAGIIGRIMGDRAESEYPMVTHTKKDCELGSTDTKNGWKNDEKWTRSARGNDGVQQVLSFQIESRRQSLPNVPWHARANGSEVSARGVTPGRR